MKKIIILSTFLITTLSISASVWQRCEFVDEAKINNLFTFNDEIIAEKSNNNSSTNSNYKKVENSWERIDTGFFSKTIKIIGFKQSGNVAFISSRNGQYRTYDAGVNWEKLDIPTIANLDIIDSTIFGSFDNSYKLFKLEKDSKDWKAVTYMKDGELDTVTSTFIECKDNFIISVFSDDPNKIYLKGDIFFSSDKGNTWKVFETLNQKIYTLVLHNDIIFAGASDKHLYISNDYGDTWLVDTNKIMPIDKLLSYNGNIYAAVNRVAEQFDLEAGLFVSSDNGINWTKIHNDLDRIKINKIVGNKSELYVVNDKSKLFETNIDNIRWERSKIYEDTIQVSSLIQTNDTIFSNGGYRGIQYSIDNGFSWKTYSESLYSQYSKNGRIYKYNSIVIAISQYNTGFRISTDYGKTWRPETTGTLSNDPFIGKFLFLDDKIIMTSSLGMKYSYDNGDSWQFYESSNLDSNVSSNLIIRDYDSIYISTSLGLMKSTDNADNWELISDVSLLGEYIGLLDRLEGVLYSYVYGKGIYQSKDEGKSWEILTTKPLDYLFSNNLKIVNGYFVFSVADGVIVSSDKGNTWEEYFLERNENEDPIIFNDIEISEDYLIAATQIGIYRAKLSDLGIVKSSVESEIERNYLYTYPPYPNPAKSEVKVLFYWDINLPMTTDDISIYDITGKKIDAVGKLSLVKQENHYGNLIWDCSSAQPGIYLINIKHGTEEKAVKVVVE